MLQWWIMPACGHQREVTVWANINAPRPQIELNGPTVAVGAVIIMQLQAE